MLAICAVTALIVEGCSSVQPSETSETPYTITHAQTPTSLPTLTPTPSLEPSPTPTIAPSIDDYFEYNWSGEYVTDEFKEKVVDISTKLEMNPDDLMAVMAFESGGINPTAVNSIGATGLIQFMPDTAEELGTSTDELVEMTAVEQLDYVYMYYEQLTGQLNSLGDAYMAVLAGKYSDAVTASDDYVLWSEGSNTYNLNRGLDINRDGSITKGEATKMVEDRRDSYGKK